MKTASLLGKVICASLAVCRLASAAPTEEGASTIPAAIIASDGILPNEPAAMNGTCDSILGQFGQKPVATKELIDESQLQPAVAMNCQKFQSDILKAKQGVITQSIQLTETCIFPKASLKIAAPNISLDCKNSVFTGGEPNRPSLYAGLTFPQNSADSGQSSAWLPVIGNIRISNCHFENYRSSGIRIGNRFNTKNPLDRDFLSRIVLPMQSSDQFDLPGKASPIDEIRRLSPSRISISNVQIRNTGNTGFYVQTGVNRVDISGLKIIHSRLGVYLDSASREITVRNSCFLYTGIPDPRGGEQPEEAPVIREAIAIDASAMNLITNNIFYRPHEKSGGVYLYKNCWERFDNHEWDPNAAMQMPRRQQSNLNKIENNIFVGGRNGISVAQRQWKAMTYSNPASNDGLMRCGDRHVDEALGSNNTTFRTYADYAQQNQIRGNTFFNAVIPVLLQDDKNILDGNFFRGSKSTVMAHVGHAKDIKYRGRAVQGNIVSNNVSHLRGIFDTNKLLAFHGGSEKTTAAKSNSHEPATTPPQPGDLIVDFSCAVWNNNGGCKKAVSCPPGRKLTTVRAACDLEQPKVSNAQVEGTAWNQLKVIAGSAVAKDGACSLAAHGKNFALSSGARSVSLSGATSIEVFCKEKDSNGGDCEIQGQLRCE